MLNFITRYKKYLLGIALTVALLFSFRWYVSTKESIAYDKGFQSANIQWEKKGKEYANTIEKYRSDNAVLNGKLNAASEEKIKLEEKRKEGIVKQQISYSKTTEASKKGLDDDMIRLYNESLGE